MLPADVAVRVSHISKRYRLYDSSVGRILQICIGFLGKIFFKEFWALQDVSFEIKKGEAFAIIGRNGAGKSSLLQIMAGTLTPTSGDIQTQGRVGALLELGSGFNPEFTGRENIYLNGAIIGFSREQMDKLVPQILEFADIDSFIDQALKTYSSGMAVRLAFSVQAFTRPEILIVDEALSVGDLFFTQKCARLMQELRDAGTTIVYVSHDLSSVRNMCARAAYLKKGKLVECGPTQQVIRNYYLEGSQNSEQISDDGFNLENSNIQVQSFEILDEKQVPKTSFVIGEKVQFEMKWTPKKDFDACHFSISLKNKMDQVVFCGGSFNLQQAGQRVQAHHVYRTILTTDLNLEGGSYSVIVSVGAKSNSTPLLAEKLIEFKTTQIISVTWDYERQVPPFYGMFGLPHSVTTQKDARL